MGNKLVPKQCLTCSHWVDNNLCHLTRKVVYDAYNSSGGHHKEIWHEPYDIWIPWRLEWLMAIFGKCKGYDNYIRRREIIEYHNEEARNGCI